MVRLESGAPAVKGSRWNSVLYIVASWDPFEMVDRGVAAAAALSGGARPRTAKVLPPSLDGFGWCTWDAFYSTVSARGLAEGLSSLENGGVSPQLLIIDDGWQVGDSGFGMRAGATNIPSPIPTCSRAISDGHAIVRQSMARRDVVVYIATSFGNEALYCFL